MTGRCYAKFQLNDSLDRLHADVQSQRRRIETQIIVRHILPDSSGVETVIALAVTVQTVNVPHGVRTADALSGDFPLHAALVGRVNVELQNIRLVPQDKIRCPTDADIAFAVQKLAENFGLIVEEIFIAEEVSTLRRDQLAVIDPARYLVEQGLSRVFIRPCKDRFTDAAVVGGQTQKLAVVQVDAVIRRQLLPDIAAAAGAEGPGDGNGKVRYALLLQMWRSKATEEMR